MGERHYPFFHKTLICSSLICVECLAFIILASSSCFSCISCSELLGFIVRKYPLVFSLIVVSNKLIGVWLKGNYHVGSGEKKCLHNLVDRCLEYLILFNCFEI